jgi:hypothetical protein
MKSSTDFLYNLHRTLLKLPRAGPREQTGRSRENPLRRPFTNRIATYFVPGLGWMSVYLGCQGPTLVTTRVPSSSGPVNGMLYYLPIGKITIKGEFKPSPAISGSKSTAQNNLTGANPDGGGSGSQPTAGATTITAGQLTITLTPEVEADVLCHAANERHL